MARFPRPALIALTFALALFLSAGSALAVKTYWFETYLHAVDLIDQGQGASAIPVLEELVASLPAPRSSVRISGAQYIDYLPYYQLARAHMAAGDLESASRELQRSFDHGALVLSQRRHARTLDELRAALEFNNLSATNR